MPRARPLITITPARERTPASGSATASPSGGGSREPTMAARGPSGGAHRPRVRRSGCDILEPVAQGLEDVAFADLLGAVEVGRGTGDSPGPVEAACAEPALFRPAFERPPRRRLQPGQLP